MTIRHDRRNGRAWRLSAALVAGALLLFAPQGIRAETAPPLRAGTVVGRVTDARTGQPLGGTTVEVSSTVLRAVTDADGRYRLVNVPNGAQVILARRIGYAAIRQAVTVTEGQQATADFALEAAPFSLDEIVITGTAGGELRRTLGNSVSSIDAGEALERSAAPNLSALLNARSPGTIVTPGTGRTGAGSTIQIRGRSTLSLSSEPIVYIDGVRVNNAVNQGPSGAGASSFGSQNSQVASRLNDINPDDIESIEVIKGPAASTIYGTEAANGVIQIITKKGRNGPARWTASIQQGAAYFANPEGRIPTNFRRNAAGDVVAWNGYQQEADSGRAFYSTGHTQSYSLGVSGGRENLTYYVSGTYDDEEGIEPNNFGKNFSGHANVGFSPSSAVDVQTSLNYVRSSTHLGADNGVSPLFGALLGHSLLAPVINRGFQFVPPEVPQRLYDNRQDINRFTGGVTVNHRPTSWFSQRIIVGADFTSDDSRGLERFAPPDLVPLLASLGGAAVSGGRISQTLRNNNFITGDYSGTARFKLTSKVSSSSSIGANLIKKQLRTSALAGQNFPAPGLELVSSATIVIPPGQSEVENTTLGVWGQQQFGWNDRLFLTAALRVDNNSAFGDDFDWVTYPKLSGAWVVSEEPFWSGLGTTVNTLKLRAAYGQSGQQPDAFAAQRTFVAAGRASGEPGLSPGSFGNDALKPERGTEFEAGFEATLFDRVSLDFTWFTKRTKDAILQQPTAPSGGFPGNQVVNIGEVKNSGVELQAVVQAITTDRLAWDVTLNMGTNEDEVVDMGALAFAGSTNIRSVVGFPINGYWGRKVVSADRDPTTHAVSNIRCDGGSGNPSVSCLTAPEVFLGTPTPKFTGAVSSSLTLWNRLTFYGLVDWKRGHFNYNANEQVRCGTFAELCDAFYNRQNYETLYLASIDASVPRASIIAPFVQDASFFRLSEVSASYRLPDRLLGGLGISEARFSLAGRNLHLWTDYAGLDPESRAGPTDQAITPPLRRITATLHLTF
jgi:TonB-linked SusC/RagA family outer membrane protein